MKINLFSFSHAKCSGNIRKLVYCTDGVRKISPLQGDGNIYDFSIDFVVISKEDKSPARGRKRFLMLFKKIPLSSKEDKSPARGRKPSPNFIDLSCSVRKISPLQGDGNPRTHTVHIQFLTVRKISPLQGDGNLV